MEGLGILGRLGLEDLLLFMYPTLFSSGLLTAWRAAEKFFAEYFGFLFDNTSPGYLCVCISLPLLFLLITTMVVINFGLECFTNSVLAYIYIPHIHCLFISLCWYFWGSKRSLVFYTLIEHSIGIRVGTLIVV